MDNDDPRAEERRRAAEDAAMKGNGADAETTRSYPPIPPRSSLIARPDQRTTANLTPKCVVRYYLYAEVALLVAAGKTGKTTLELWEAVHIVLGLPLYGLEVVTPGPVVFIIAEDGSNRLFSRLCAVMDAMDLSDQDREKVWAGVEIWDVTGLLCRLAELDSCNNVQLTGLADAIVEHFKDRPPVVLNFDPVVSFGAGERLVNDNEQSLILAARRIVVGLGETCCVRFTSHTGKENARQGTTDQYSSRGGSALPDGARMVSVLHFLEPDEPDDKFLPPIGFPPLGPEEHAVVLVRRTLSFIPPGLPKIWLKRRGHAYEHYLATKPAPEAEAAVRADQLERFLISELAAGRRHTKHTLEAVGTKLMSRAQLRAALDTLMSEGRVWLKRLPDNLRHSGRATYLHPGKVPTSPPPTTPPPADDGSARAESEPNSEDSAGSEKTSPDPHPPTGGGGTGGEVPPVPPPLPPGNLAGEGRRGSARSARLGEDGEEREVEDGDEVDGHDTRHLLPPAALAEIPADEEGRPRIKVTIVGKNAACVNILSQSAWTIGDWGAFARRHYGDFASVIGGPAPGTDSEVEGGV
jgi:RecA-family ATPase